MNHYVEPPWRTPVTIRMIKRKEREVEKHKVKPCDDLDESQWWYNWKRLELREKEKNETIEISKLMSLRSRELNHLDETRVRITLCLSFINLNWWRANGFGIILILVKKIKKGMAPTSEGLQRTTGRIWKARMHKYDTRRKKTLERTTVRIEKERLKHEEAPGRIRN